MKNISPYKNIYNLLWDILNLLLTNGFDPKHYPYEDTPSFPWYTHSTLPPFMKMHQSEDDIIDKINQTIPLILNKWIAIMKKYNKDYETNTLFLDYYLYLTRNTFLIFLDAVKCY